MLIRYLFGAFLGLLMSCGHLESGHYVRSAHGLGWKSLSQKYGVPVWKLKSANRGRTPSSGGWIFIPLDGGLLNAEFKGGLFSSTLGSQMFSWPVPSSRRVSSHFGMRWGRPHEGIDISAKRGSKIVAAAAGVVVYSGAGLGGYGNLTVLSHRGGFFTVYAHAQKNFTKKGQRVSRGEVIALVGQTGRSTGPHLHFEIRRDSLAIDPRRKLPKLYGHSSR